MQQHSGILLLSEPTLIATDIDELGTMGAEVDKNPAHVNALLGDEPDGGQEQVVWIGTPSGLHHMTFFPD